MVERVDLNFRPLQNLSVRNFAEQYKPRYEKFIEEEQVQVDEQIILERVWKRIGNSIAVWRPELCTPR